MHQYWDLWSPRTEMVRRFGAKALLAYAPGPDLLSVPCKQATTEELQVLDPKFFDDLSKRVAEGMPGNLQTLQKDFERNLRTALEGALRQLNLVTRDEFDIQQAVLQRTREKLEALEARVAELEQGQD